MLNVCGEATKMNVKEAFAVKPVKQKIERLTEKEDRIKYAKKDHDYWDKTHKNPGQFGNVEQILDTEIQKIKAKHQVHYAKPWKTKKKK